MHLVFPLSLRRADVFIKLVIVMIQIFFVFVISYLDFIFMYSYIKSDFSLWPGCCLFIILYLFTHSNLIGFEL